LVVAAVGCHFFPFDKALMFNTIATPGERMTTTARRLAAPALTAMIALISGCGSTTPVQTDGSGGGGGGGTAATREQAVKFAECIRTNGVSAFPDPNASGQFAYGIPSRSSPLNPNSAAWTAAISACKSLEPSGFIPTSFTPAQKSARLKFAQCVRANGVPSFPDPTSSGPLIDVTNGQSIPGLQAAIQKCIHLNPEAVQ
jgi:hypothetical protein